MRNLTTLLLAGALLVSAGCAHNTAKPNAAQHYGWWAYVFPWTQGSKDRRAEKKSTALDEQQRRLTFAVDQLINRVPLTNSVPLESARKLSAENVVVHGTPAAPVDVDALLTLDPKVRTAAWEELTKDFKTDHAQLKFVAERDRANAKTGQEINEQNSSARVTAWNITDAIARFITAHWIFLLVVAVILFYAGRAALAVYNPALALGVNKVTGMGMAGIKKMAVQLTQGGENFETWVEGRFRDNPQLMQEISGAFVQSHRTAQDQDVQLAVKQLTTEPAVK